jgi:hypothetical protein
MESRPLQGEPHFPLIEVPCRKSFAVAPISCFIPPFMSSLAATEPSERLSDALERLLHEANGQPMRIREMVEALQGRGLQMVIILLCLPFGFAIMLSGVRIAFGHRPWLPGFILNRSLSYPSLERMVTYGCRVHRKIERVVRPRMSAVLDAPGMTMVTGLTIALAGFLLSLPIPPPFPLTNTIPGFAIIFLSLGSMERDGRTVLWGYALTALATIYVAAIAVVGKAGAVHLWKFLSGLFQ